MNVKKTLQEYCDRNGYVIVRDPRPINKKDKRFTETWTHRAYVRRKADPTRYMRPGGYEVACCSGKAGIYRDFQGREHPSKATGTKGLWRRLN